MAVHPDKNTTGALIFYAYIVAALSLSGLICGDLLNEYISRKKESGTQHSRKGSTNQLERDIQIHTKISTLTALSVLSFAVLSYSMLGFLIESYQTWIPLQNSGATSVSNIWKWSTNSRLFRDFGEVICNDPRRFWWTKLALAYSLGWNVYMTIEGVRDGIPHLWAYFLLDQILPVSFTQNLFLLAVVCRRGKQSAVMSNLSPPMIMSQILLVSAYFAVLAAAPSSVGTPWFFPVLLSTRALLFAPFLLLRPQPSMTNRLHSAPSKPGHQHRASPASPTRHLLQHENRWALATVAVYVTWQLTLGLISIPHPTTAVISALHDSPAVSALGYDLLIGVFSLVVSAIVEPGEFPTKPTT